jgi:dolichol-phosphate mannosyltransferase
MNNRIVIIPTYNEIENINAIIEKVLSLKPHFNVLIVDDGSPDGTANAVKLFQKEILKKIKSMTNLPINLYHHIPAIPQ